jgi:hypothetical protein
LEVRTRSDEAVDAELDRLVSRRASTDNRRDPLELEPGYAESVRRYREREHREINAERYRFHADQAERLRRAMTQLVEHHEGEARRLLEGGA